MKIQPNQGALIIHACSNANLAGPLTNNVAESPEAGMDEQGESRTRPRDLRRPAHAPSRRMRDEALERQVCPLSWVDGPAPGPPIAKRQREAAGAKQMRAFVQSSADEIAASAAAAAARAACARAEELQATADASKAELLRTQSATQAATLKCVTESTKAVMVSKARYLKAFEHACVCARAFSADKKMLAEAVAKHDSMVLCQTSGRSTHSPNPPQPPADTA